MPRASLDEEFSTIMAARKKQPVADRPITAIPSSNRQARNNIPVPPSWSECGRSNERTLSQPSIQGVIKKYDTIVKGFKVLEAGYEESKTQLAATEAQLSAADAAREALLAEMEVAARTIREHEMVIKVLREEVETNKTTQRERETEIENIRAELEKTKTDLGNRQKTIQLINDQLEEILVCGICHSMTVQPFSTDCRHTFCGACLFEWWQNSPTASCPACRTICKNLPVRDNSSGLASIVSATTPVRDMVPFNPNSFVFLMMQLRGEAVGMDGVEIDHNQFPEGDGTFIDPLDLTGE